MGDFVAHQKPCPNCGGSDPVSINSNGSAKCFSCGTFSKTMNLQWEETWQTLIASKDLMTTIHSMIHKVYFMIHKVYFIMH